MNISDKVVERKYPTVTLSFALVLLIVYFVQLLIGGSLTSNAAFQTAKIVNSSVGSGWIVFSWLFHSSHIHLLENLAVFILTGWWVENRVETERFILGVAVGLGIAANVAALIIFQTGGVGISGITTGLGAIVALGSLQGLMNPDSHILEKIALVTISTCYLLWSTGAIAPLPSGTAVEIHILGACFGAIWYLIEKSQYRFEYGPK